MPIGEKIKNRLSKLFPSSSSKEKKSGEAAAATDVPPPTGSSEAQPAPTDSTPVVMSSAIIKFTKNPNFTKPSGRAAYARAIRRYGQKLGGLDATGHNIYKFAENKVLAKDTSGNFNEVPAQDIQNGEYLEPYVVPVTIGTPGATLNLDFDTGSSDLWVWSSEVKVSTSGHTIYNPSKSSTSKIAKGQTWSISYGDGSSASAGMCEDWHVNRFPEGPWFTSQFDDPKCSLEPAWTSSTADQSEATSSPQDRTFESIAERRQALLAEDDREYFDTMGEDLDPDWQETWDELCAVCGVRERPNIQRMFSRQFVNKMQLGDGEGYARRLEYCHRLARQVMNSNGQDHPSEGEVKDLVEILMRTVQPALAVDFDLSNPDSHPRTPLQLKEWSICETPFLVPSSRFRLEEWSRCRTSVAIGHVSRSRTQKTSETNDHPPAQERTPKVSRFFKDGKWFFEPGWDVQVHRVRGCKSEAALISHFQWAVVPTDGVDADIHHDGAKHTGAGTTEREERLAHNEIQVSGGTSLNFWCHEGCWLYLRAWLTEQMDKRKVAFPGQFRPAALNGERVTNRGRDESDTEMSFAGEFYEIVNSSKRGKAYGLPGDIYPGPIVDQCDPLQEGFEKRFLANGGRMSRVGRRYQKDRANIDQEALLDDWSLDLGAWQCHDPTIWPSTHLIPDRSTIQMESASPMGTQKLVNADTKFSLLPPEILESVLITLDLCDIFLFSRTCRSIYTLVHSQLDSLIKLRICDKEAEHSLFWILPVLEEEVSSFMDSLGKDDERSEKFRAIRSASREEVEVVEDGPDSKTIVSRHTLHLDSDAHPCPPDLLAQHDILSYLQVCNKRIESRRGQIRAW